MPLLPEIKLGATPDDDKIESLVRQLNAWARLISTESHSADFGEGTIYLKNNQLILKKPSGEEIILAGQQDLNAPITEDSNFLAITASSIEANSITADQISSLNFSGKTAVFDTGSIGGFDLGADYIRDSADTFGMASTVTGSDDVRFWAGDSFANRASAPFRVTEAGFINATDIKIAGQVSALEPLSVTGEEPDINAAITAVSDAGGGTVNLRSGTYSPTTDILLKSGVNLIGEKESTTIIDFDSNSASIKFEDDDVYTTGTITSITSGVMVTGSGTSWLANASAGQYLFLAGRHYPIAAVTSDTTLVLGELYIGNASLPGASYRISTILTDVDVFQLTVKNSADDGLAIRGGKNIVLENVTFQTNNTGIDWDYVTEFRMDNIITAVSTSDGMQLSNVGFGAINVCPSVSNGGNGLTLDTVESVPFLFCASNGNIGDGINATSVTKSYFALELRANGGQGCEFVSGCNENIILGMIAANNASDGIKLTATSDNNILNQSIFDTNGGYGVNIAASTCDENLISSNQYISNVSGDYNDSGTDTIIIEANAVDSVNSQTGTVVLDPDDLDDTSTDHKFVTASDLTNLGNLSGTNTGDQTLPVKATGAEVDTGTDDAKFLTPKAITDSTYAKEAYADGKVSDTAYGAGWNGDTTVAPSKNAIYDKIETMGGGGDMDKATYDPQTIEDDAFDQDNMTDGTTNKNYTATEQTKLSNIEDNADVTDATNVNAAGATMNTDTTLAGNGYFLDEDNMASDSATKVPSQQSVKAYVDAQVGGGGLLPWTEVTGTSQSASINNGYITNNAGLVTVTIPTTAPVGSIVRISGKGAGGWKVAQNASEVIHFGSVDTTTGTGGSLASTNRYDAVELICTVADTEWLVLSSVGNIEVT